jgi:hypothetical protein
MRHIKLFESYSNQYDIISYREVLNFLRSHNREIIKETEIKQILDIIPKFITIDSRGDDYYRSGFEGDININTSKGSIVINDPFTLHIEKYSDDWFIVTYGTNDDGDIQRQYKCDEVQGVLNLLNNIDYGK